MNARRKASKVKDAIIGMMDPKLMMMLVGLLGVRYEGSKNTEHKVTEVKDLVDTVYVAIATGREINARQDAKIEALERIMKRYELRATVETRKAAKLADADKKTPLQKGWSWITGPIRALTGG